MDGAGTLQAPHTPSSAFRKMGTLFIFRNWRVSPLTPTHRLASRSARNSVPTRQFGQREEFASPSPTS